MPTKVRAVLVFILRSVFGVQELVCDGMQSFREIILGRYAMCCIYTEKH
jgi:hypothetical protein